MHWNDNNEQVSEHENNIKSDAIKYFSELKKWYEDNQLVARQ